MKRFVLIAVYILITLVVLAIASVYSGIYLQLIGDRYGREYNDERIKKGQPIIEQYFIKKPKKDKQLMVWSDTTKSHTHTDKSYYLNEIGTLQYEIDYYKIPADTVWLMKQLNLTELDTLESYEFQRVFYPNKGVDSYRILFNLKGKAHGTAILNRDAGDSLYQALK